MIKKSEGSLSKELCQCYCSTQAGEVLHPKGVCGVLPKASMGTGVSQH